MRRALDALRAVAEDDGPGGNIMAATIALAHAGGTTGEWAGALRQVFGEFRAPTGVGAGSRPPGAELRPLVARTKALAARLAAHPACWWPSRASTGTPTGPSRSPWPPTDAGFEVIYQGIRLTPAQIVAAARDEDVDIVGLSILSGFPHGPGARRPRPPAPAGVGAAVVVGGIIPSDDADVLRGKGVASVYTPKDFSFGRIMEDLVALAERHRAAVRA